MIWDSFTSRSVNEFSLGSFIVATKAHFTNPPLSLLVYGVKD